MKYIKEVLKCGSISEMEAEIAARHKAIEDMVGQLYPGIMRSEINQIQLAIKRLKENAQYEALEKAAAESEVIRMLGIDYKRILL